MRDKGFTLVEMLLVLAIVGILVTIILPSVVGVTMDAKVKQAKADLRMLQAAVGQYYIRYNTFPTSQAGATDETWVGELLSMSPRVVEKRPQDPFAPVSPPAAPPVYGYKFRPAGAGEIPTYIIWSVGISGQEDAAVTGSDQIYHSADCIYVTNASDEGGTSP
jgi:general secretion pathway protein G